ncbi:helix-turn-helix domain-containing protein [Pedobacter psychroterrae]|uniref:Helix-turn-helix domain-containing protein n=1 Tax=Pedobacter psychroterrae TaxID=2530453 RepID=A0A4R0NTE4_9SPHI|nr:helix-turn-helix domain-containing protein [Pedobacter psychroterrae]TCD03193.1 helix-turn-helix domain-containing protein [Pedobacter psychroterrae]
MKENTFGYNTFRIPVSPAYQEVFSHFYFAENKSSEIITKTLLPSYQTILIFSFGAVPSLKSGQNTLIDVENCLMLGPIKHAFEYTLPAGAEILTVNFKDDAFYRFFGNAAIAEHVPINPDELLNEDCFTVLWHELNKLDRIEDRVNHILKFSDPYLIYRPKVAEQLANFSQQALNPIKAVADQNNQTERNIQLNHKKHFGYSAKELGRYQRFLKAIDLIQTLAKNASKIDWFEIISECGYYDQSQLIHDFKHYINLSPAKYLKFQQDICNPIS